MVVESPFTVERALEHRAGQQMQQDEPYAASNDSRLRNNYQACLPVTLGALAALAGMLLVAVVWVAWHRIPVLTDQGFADAEARWHTHRPANYEIEIKVTGRQPATYRVVVTDGVPTTAERNGNVLPQPRVWKTWSVDGMFTTIRRDLVNEDRQSGKLLLRAEFDPVYGYPSRYLRIQFGQPSDVSWNVTRFVDLGSSRGNDRRD